MIAQRCRIDRRQAALGALPARRGKGARRRTHDGVEHIEAALQLRRGVRERQRGQAVVPVDMVVAVHADFVAGVGQGAHVLRKRARDLRSGQQRAVEQRPPAIHARHIGAHRLGEEPGLEQPAHCAAGVIGPAGDEEAGGEGALLQRLRQRRDAVAQADVRIDVDFDSQLAGGSSHDTARRRRSRAQRRAGRLSFFRNHATVWRSPSASGVVACTPSTRCILVTSGTRRPMSS
jgi:hypothetical protein